MYGCQPPKPEDSCPRHCPLPSFAVYNEDRDTAVDLYQTLTLIKLDLTSAEPVLLLHSSARLVSLVDASTSRAPLGFQGMLLQ